MTRRRWLRIRWHDDLREQCRRTVHVGHHDGSLAAVALQLALPLGGSVHRAITGGSRGAPVSGRRVHGRDRQSTLAALTARVRARCERYCDRAGTFEWVGTPRRPRRMHRATFERLLARAASYRQRWRELGILPQERRWWSS